MAGADARASDNDTLRSGFILKGRQATYQINSVVKRGGFGIIYSATPSDWSEEAERNGDPKKYGYRVAIKEFFWPPVARRRNDGFVEAVDTANQQDFAAARESFDREAELLTRLKSDYVVRVFDRFAINGTTYYAMEYIPGGTLQDRIKPLGPGGAARRQNRGEILDWAAPLMRVLDSLHHPDAESVTPPVVHRDLTPNNIMFRDDGRPVLIDFGIARFEATSREGTMSMFGLPGYASPEIYSPSQSAGEIGPWTDVYSLAACIYFAAAGATPKDCVSRGSSREDEEEMSKGLAGIAQREGLGFGEALADALILDRRRRTQNMHQFLERLTAPDPVRPARKGPSGRALIIAIGALSLAVVGVVLAMLMQQRASVSGPMLPAVRADAPAQSSQYRAALDIRNSNPAGAFAMARACADSDPWCTYLQCQMTKEGEGGQPRDLGVAFELCRRAADGNVPDAMLMTADIVRGQSGALPGVGAAPEDRRDMAQAYYRKAAGMGLPEGYRGLGLVLQEAQKPGARACFQRARQLTSDPRAQAKLDELIRSADDTGRCPT